jgi:hypothetical protein
LLIVTATAPVVATNQFVSVAFVAVTLHVPAEENVKAPVPETIEQPVAVPFVTENVIAPLPEPPDVPTVHPVGYVPDVLVRVRAV